MHFRIVAALAALVTVAGPATAVPITHEYRIAPFEVCTVSAGCGETVFDPDFVGRVYAQIGVGLKFEDPIDLLLPIDTVFGGPGLDAGDALWQVARAQRNVGLAGDTIYVGFTPQLGEGVLGLAYENEPGFPIWPFAVIDSTRAPQVVSNTLAHEIGHVLGGKHTFARDVFDLMWPYYDVRQGDPDFFPRISPANRDAILASPLLAPVQSPVPQAATIPLPAPILMLGAAILALGTLRERARSLTPTAT